MKQTPRWNETGNQKYEFPSDLEESKTSQIFARMDTSEVLTDNSSIHQHSCNLDTEETTAYNLTEKKDYKFMQRTEHNSPNKLLN